MRFAYICFKPTKCDLLCVCSNLLEAKIGASLDSDSLHAGDGVFTYGYRTVVADLGNITHIEHTHC